MHDQYLNLGCLCVQLGYVALSRQFFFSLVCLLLDLYFREGKINLKEEIPVYPTL